MSKHQAQSPLPVAKDYGAFHLDWLMMRLEVDPKEYLDLTRFRAFKASTTDLNKKVEFALSQAAFVHETRHFHDVFGTRAGINFFLARLSVLQEFVQLAKVLFEKRKPWVLPVTKASKSDLPPEAWRFLQHALKMNQIFTRFQGKLPSIISDEIPEQPVPHVSQLREEALESMIYAFPARATRVTAEGKQIPAIQHIPIAFDALLEGNAQVMQRNMIETLWGKEVADQMFLLTGVTLREPEGGAAHAPTYNATDLMVTRYMQNATGNGQFPRNALLALTDVALTVSILITRNPDGTHAVGFQCPGHSFVDLLGNTKPEAIRAGNIEPPLDEGYRQLHDYYAALPSFETVDETMAGPAADIEVVFRWVGRAVIAPLLEARLSTHHQLFSDGALWISRLSTLPPVPFRIKADGTCISSAPRRVIEAWLRIRMIERFLAQLITGEPAILCPRAHKTAPGIEKVNFAHTGDCGEYIAADLCGRFQAGMPLTALPDCRFRDHLLLLGFAMPERKKKSRAASS